MKRLLAYLFFSVGFVAAAQDKIYLLDGSCRIAKVLEIAPDYITIVPLSESGAPFINSNETIQKNTVLLVEYKNGTIEVYNKPDKTTAYTSNTTKTIREKKDAGNVSLFNLASLNTLALCNSDITGFFERLVQNKKLGFGAMASYNFNKYVTAPNSFMFILNNAKKNYDVGIFANFYPAHFKRRTTFSMGLMIKYTSFNFSSIIEEKIGTATNIKYVASKGDQLATIVTIGTHRYLSKNFFVKTLAGIGVFRLKGDYKQQFNYLSNKENKPGDPVYNYNFLPKIYLGLNFGYNF